MKKAHALAALGFLSWLPLGTGGLAPPAFGEDMHAHHRAMAIQRQEVEAKSVDVRLLDLELVDRDGQPVRFRSDVIRDRLVAINFIYTTCTTVCPIQSAIFHALQEALGDRLDREVFLVSISVDPNTDIPARLDAYAGRYRAKPGWSWLTGEKENVDRVLLGLGSYSANITEHSPAVLVGDGELGGWTRFYGFPSAERILARLDQLHALKQAAALDHQEGK